MKIAQPFLELVFGAVGKAAGEGIWLGEFDLGRVDDDATDWGLEEDAAGEDVEGHLVVGFVFVEVIGPEGGGGGFAIHD